MQLEMMLGPEPELSLRPGPEAGLARRLMLRSLGLVWRLSNIGLAR